MRLITTFLLMFLALNSHSQTWFETGLRGGPTFNLLTSKNVFDDNAYFHQINLSYFYGGKLGVNFGEHNGIAINIGQSFIKQGFTNTHENRSFDQLTYSAKTTDFGLLFHRTKESGYIELGPKASIVNSSDIKRDGLDKYSIKEETQNTIFGFDLGFGSYFIGSDRLTLMTGFRISYGFTPLLKDDRVLTPYAAQAGNAHLFTAMLALELNYSLGYLVRSSCGKRTAWISF